MAKKQSPIDKLLGRNKPEPEPALEPIEFNEPDKKEPEVEEFMEIGGSPMPGLVLRQVLRGHTDSINEIAWSPITKRLISTSVDESICFWDAESGHLSSRLLDDLTVWSVDWSSTEKFIASRTTEKIKIWEYSERNSQHSTIVDQSNGTRLSWSPDGSILAYVSNNNNICFWDSVTSKIIRNLRKHEASIYALAWSKDGKFLASGSNLQESMVCVWDTESCQVVSEFRLNSESIFDLTWISDRELLLAATHTGKIHVFDIKKHRVLLTIEGHTSGIDSLTLSATGKCLASKSRDNTVRFWNSSNWETLGIINEEYNSNLPFIAFHPHMPMLATLGEKDTVIRIWEFDEALLLGEAHENIQYTTAKLVLVGDSGVGKTGLGWRLAHNEFKEHSSTHGQQFWVVPELRKTREDGTECEAVLWDLAGQHIYRSIHSIFLDDVDASLVLFDPTNRQEPLKGAQFWLEQLKGKKQLPPSVLVGARLDRGAPVLSQQELDQFCQKYGISGGYIGTSAKGGEGLDKLVETLKNQIPWDQMTTTVTTVTFKRIKEFVLSLKEKTDRKGVLVRPNELRKQLQATNKNWQFTDAEMMTAVGHLANHGYVSILHSSSGEEFILLVPELLASVAASIFLHADKHPRELGAINETELLQGKYPIEEFKGLEKEEQHVLLDATVVRFLEHSLCFRETLGNDNLLIFPSLIKQKRPLQDDIPSSDDISYIVRGRVENIYAMMVVLLGYTPSFNRINQWQNQAQYETREGNICGFRMVEDREGEIELVLYHGEKMSRIEQREFQVLFERFLYQRDVEVQPVPPVRCPNNHLQERATVIKRQREGKKVIFCSDCGEQINLPNLADMQTIGTSASKWLEGAESIARLRSAYEAHLSRVKGYRRDWAIPRCYISCISEQAEWKGRLVDDLGKAGVFVVEKTEQVQNDDFVILLDTKAYQQAWKKGDKTLDDDFKLIKNRLSNGKHKLISIAMEGMSVTLHDIQNCQRGNFCDESHYPVSLFDLVLNLYAIPLTHAGFTPLRQSLHQQWERNYKENQSTPNNDKATSPSGQEIFVSYAWGGESEKLVNELDQAFQNRGVTMVRDKRDLGFKGSIKGFMETIGKGKAVILVISEKYLKSENCMFELLQVAKHGDFAARIFPVVLRDANIYKAKDRVVYLQYWQQQIDELDTAIKSGGSVANIQGIQDDLNLYTEIRANIAKLTDVLKDMNTLTPEMHEDSGFSVIFDAVMAKLEE